MREQVSEARTVDVRTGTCKTRAEMAVRGCGRAGGLRAGDDRLCVLPLAT